MQMVEQIALEMGYEPDGIEKELDAPRFEHYAIDQYAPE